MKEEIAQRSVGLYRDQWMRLQREAEAKTEGNINVLLRRIVEWHLADAATAKSNALRGVR